MRTDKPGRFGNGQARLPGLRDRAEWRERQAILQKTAQKLKHTAKKGPGISLLSHFGVK
jgi:hypothetical protein